MMKICAYCGRDCEESLTHCSECGTAEFVVRKEKSLPVPAVPEREFPDVEPDVAPEEESLLCPSCLFPNRTEVTWCKRCGAPIGLTTAIVPTDAAHSVGFVYRGAVRGRPKPVVLFGVWLLFFPGWVANVFILYWIFTGGSHDGHGLGTIWLAIIGIAISSTMLYRVTRNYFTRPVKGTNDPLNERPVP